MKARRQERGNLGQTLFSSVFITLFTLLMTVPLSPGETPGQLALSRWLDTLLAVTTAVAMIRLVGPRLASGVARRSIRRTTQASLAVLDHIERGDELSLPGFVEQRRRLQWSLLRVGSALQVASEADARRAEPLLVLERACARVGYMILGASWGSRVTAQPALLDALRTPLRQAASVRTEVPDATRELSRALNAAGGFGPH